MKSSILLSVIALIALVSIVCAIALLGESSQDPARGTLLASPAAVNGPTADSSAGEDLSTPLEAATTGASRATVGTSGETNGADQHRWWIDGRIELPDGVEPDPTLVVLALREARRGARLYGSEGVFAEWSRGGADVLPEGCVAAAEVSPSDGSFRIGVPRELERSYLVLQGRYLDSPEPRVVELERAATLVVLQPRLGAWLTGSVRCGNAVAEAGLAVRLRPETFEHSTADSSSPTVFSRLTLTDGAGCFEFRAVPAGRPFSVYSRSQSRRELAASVVPGVQIEAGTHRELELRFDSGASAAGRVVDEAGRPVSGARIVARPAGTEAFAIQQEALDEVESDSAGRFTLEGLLPGSVTIDVDHDGYLAPRPLKAIARVGELLQLGDFVLSRGRTIAGRSSFGDGRAAPGVTVLAKFDSTSALKTGSWRVTRGSEGRALSGEDGWFEIGGLGEGEFVVRAEWRDTENGSLWEARAVGIESGAGPLELVLAPTQVLSGFVTDEEGRSVTEGSVRASLDRSTNAWIADLALVDGAIEAESGGFALEGLVAGTWELRVRAPGFADFGPLDVDVPLDESTPVHVVLEREAVVSGLVLDPGGRPAPDARVRVSPGRGRPAGSFAARAEWDPPETSTDGEGRFELAGLPAGTVALIATHRDYAPSEEATIQVRPTEPLDAGDLRLRRGGRITGQVYGEDGLAFAHKEVFAQSVSTLESIVEQTDEHGGFTFDRLPPATWRVVAMSVAATAEAAGEEGSLELGSMLSRMKMTTVPVRDEEEVHVVLGEPASTPVLVRGRVTVTGAALPSCTVQFTPLDAKARPASLFEQTGDDGRFELELPAPGGWSALVLPRGQGAMMGAVPFAIRIPDRSRYELELRLPGGSASGCVTDSEHRPLAGVRVSLHCEGGLPYGLQAAGRHAETQTDAEGRYRLLFLRPDVYTVAAGGTTVAGADAGHGRAVRSGLVIGPDQALEDVDFELVRGSEVRGVVRDEGGRPVAGAAVLARDERGVLLEHLPLIVTDAAGRFRYAGLAPGRYSLGARSGLLVSAERDVSVVADGRADEVELVLERGTCLIVVLRGAEESAVAATLRVINEDGKEIPVQAFSAGETSKAAEIFERRVGPLVPGRYVVELRTSDGRGAKEEVLVRGGRDVQTVRLKLDD